MTTAQSIIVILLAALATMLTRFIPFIFLPEGKKIPEFIDYLGKVLPAAVFGMLVIYCYKNIDVTSASSLAPEIIASCATVVLQLWWKQMLVSIAGGTIIYMVLVNLIFV
ncbi:MAG: AzlD domain-containing protein [Eubacteriales bacterium]|nr:AzlD domain-containing protein [Eubacteriales bacterium]